MMTDVRENHWRIHLVTSLMLALVLAGTDPVRSRPDPGPLDELLDGCAGELRLVGLYEPPAVTEPAGWHQGIVLGDEQQSAFGLFLINDLAHPATDPGVLHYLMSGWTTKPTAYCNTAACPWFDEVQQRLTNVHDPPAGIEQIVGSVAQTGCTLDPSEPQPGQDGPA